METQNTIRCAFSDMLVICKVSLVNLGEGERTCQSHGPPEEPGLSSGVGRAGRWAGMCSPKAQQRKWRPGLADEKLGQH